MSASNTGTRKRGIEVLYDPKLNKSTGFTEAERQTLGLVGLVPDLTEFDRDFSSTVSCSSSKTSLPTSSGLFT